MLKPASHGYRPEELWLAGLIMTVLMYYVQHMRYTGELYVFKVLT
jgi:hypothetical protein